MIKEEKNNEELEKNEPEEEQILVDVPEEAETADESEESSEDTDSDSPEKETDEESEDKTDKPKDKVDKSDFSEGFISKYKDKSSEELLKVIRDQESFIGKRSQEIGDLRKQIESGKKTLTSKDLKQKIKTDKEKLRKYQDKLDTLDPDLDEDEVETLSKRIREVGDELDESQSNYQDTYMKELVRTETAQEDNKKLSGEMKGFYNDQYGLNFDDDEWDAIVKNTEDFAGDVKLTEADFEATLMKGLGVKKYRKMISLQGGMNERKKMKEAINKSGRDTGTNGKTGGKMNLLSMSKSSLQKYIANNPKVVESLTPEQLRKVQNKMR